MRKIALSVLWVVIVVLMFSVLNGTVYVRYFLPPGFREATLKTYLPLMVSSSFAALIGGYIGYRVPVMSKLTVRISLGLGYAGAVAILVFNLSMFIIVNMRGE